MKKSLVCIGLASGVAIAAMSNAAVGQELTIMTSMPNLGFPFFVHMHKELEAEAGVLGAIELVAVDGQNSTLKQTSDVETAVIQGVDGHCQGKLA